MCKKLMLNPFVFKFVNASFLKRILDSFIPYFQHAIVRILRVHRVVGYTKRSCRD